MSGLKLFLLGPPRIEFGGEPVELKRRKTMAILAYLAVTDENQRRDTLATLLWPDTDQSRARAALRRDLSVLNKALGGEWLEIDRETVGLKRSADLWLDVDHLHRGLAAHETHGHPADDVCPRCLPPLDEAVELYRADFLAGFTLRDSPDFDEWQFFQAESLRQELASALERLVRGHCDQGQFGLAIPYARRWLGLDPLHEPAHRQLMQLYAWAGQQAAALRQYQECVRVLDEELGAPPEEATRALYEAIKTKRAPSPPSRAGEERGEGIEEPGREGDLSTVPLQAGSLAQPPDFPTPRRVLHVPSQPTPFIGREEELVEIGRLLVDEPACRLLTLAGPGGIGKTRLALQAATEVSQAFPHGVYFVPLDSVSAAEFLISTITEALEFSFYGGEDPKAQLLNYLREKEILLILDSIEHLLEEVDLLVDILISAPRVKLLITSRERLNLQEEWGFDVRGMQFPDPGGDGLERLEAHDAVQLFLQCARRAQAGFALSAEERPFLARICQLVAGMPLGLELAAVWVRMMFCQEIAQEIEQNLDFLATSLRNVPERHRSLRAVFEYSWQLLSAGEREVFRKLSVFRGGFRRGAAERVAGASLPLLSALVDKSLLRRTHSGRYEIHKLLRQYAAEKLQQVPGENEQVQNQHCGHYTAFLKQREDHLRLGRQREALVEIAADIDNVRAGWRRAVRQGKLEEIDHSLESLFYFYDIRSWFQEGAEAFGKAAERLTRELGSREAPEGEEREAQPQRGPAGQIPPARRAGARQPAIAGQGSNIVLAKVLARQGWFTFHLGLHEKGKELLQESLSLLRHSNGDARAEIAFCLNYLGVMARYLGDYAEAKECLQESKAICREIGNQFYLSIALNNLGQVAYLEGEYTQARELCGESLAIKREIGDRWGMTFSLIYLGAVARMLGDHAEAKQLLQESMAISEAFGDRRGTATCLNRLGDSAQALEEYDEAVQLYRESLAIFREIGNQLGVTSSLTNLGDVAYARQDYQAAQQHYLAALQTPLASQAIPQVLDVITGMAALLTKKGEGERALELLALVLKHPANSRQNQDRAACLLVELKTQLPPEMAATAQEQGQARNLEEIVAQLLDEKAHDHEA